jgi:ABC-type lipoprotein release transport system permease subunit
METRTILKAIVGVVLVVLALIGGKSLATGFDQGMQDWSYVRALRIQAIARARQRIQREREATEQPQGAPEAPAAVPQP